VICAQGIQGTCTCLIADLPVSLLFSMYVLIDFVEGNDKPIKTLGECALGTLSLITAKHPVTKIGWPPALISMSPNFTVTLHNLQPISRRFRLR